MENAGRDFGKTQVEASALALNHALKEWAATIEALSTGELVLLLRKGGLRDPAKSFPCPAYTVALFPTYEHQSPSLFKAPDLLPEQPETPESIVLQTWGQITHSFALRSPAQIAALHPFHIWTDAFIAERLKWRPQDPIQVLLVRAYRLPEPCILVRSPLYGGCKSWITLEQPLEANRQFSALTNQDYALKLKEIEVTLNAIAPFELHNFQIQV